MSIFWALAAGYSADTKPVGVSLLKNAVGQTKGGD